jgi:hypothetical protein
MEQAQVAAIFRSTLWLSALAVAVSAFWWDLPIFLGMLIGGGLAAANFWVLRRIVDSGARASTKRQGLLTALFFVKFAAMVGAVYLAVAYAPMNMVAFIVGISVAFVAVVFVSLRTMIRQSA